MRTGKIRKQHTAWSRWPTDKLKASTNSVGQPPIWFSTSNQTSPPSVWSQWVLNTVLASRGMTKRPASDTVGIGIHSPDLAHRLCRYYHPSAVCAQAWKT